MARPSIFRENRYLFFALLALVLLSNVPYGEYPLYPFTLFSTWVHEMSHGIAALAVGGAFKKLELFPDTSGMATNAYAPGTWNHVVVASAGYLGTTLVGALLLVLQKGTRLGRLLGLIAAGLLSVTLLWKVRYLTGIVYFLVLIGSVLTLVFFTRPERIGRNGNLIFGALLLSSVLFVRNLFGLLVILLLGAVLVAIAVKLSEQINNGFFSFLAATCGLNAVASIRVLFSPNFVVNGQRTGASDAHHVAEVLFAPAWVWAGLWLALSLFLLGGALYLSVWKDREQAPSDSLPNEKEIFAKLDL